MDVLVAYDGSKPAQKAVEHAFTTYPDAEIVLLRVIEAADSSTEAGISIIQEMLRGERRRSPRSSPTKSTRSPAIPTSSFGPRPSLGSPHAIVSFAEEHDIDHVIIGSHGRAGLSRILLGSVAEKIVRRAPMPVTVIR